MSAEPIETLMIRIIDQYNRNPEGWAVFIDHQGNVLVLGPRVGYRMKLIPLNPQEYTGVGIKISGLDEIRSVLDGFPSYGFRPLSARKARELFDTIRQRGTIQNNLMKNLLGMKPVSTWDLQEKGLKAILSGPVIAHPNLSTISKRQRELEAKLTKEANKLFQKKYPHKAAMYG